MIWVRGKHFCPYHDLVRPCVAATILIPVAASFWYIRSGKILLGGEDISRIEPETCRNIAGSCIALAGARQEKRLFG
ncbi:MAG: hypothetical protein LBJ60_06210 [Tannerellaceae bacterium]|jgi:hypothetical protein|nr:hypothetical protein [Tannerellaceae bacterium]